MVKCEACKWWKRWKMWTHITEAYLATHPQNIDKGDCHKNAPAVAGLSEEGYTCWPNTNSTDFCGDYEARDAQELKLKESEANHVS